MPRADEALGLAAAVVGALDGEAGTDRRLDARAHGVALRGRDLVREEDVYLIEFLVFSEDLLRRVDIHQRKVPAEDAVGAFGLEITPHRELEDALRGRELHLRLVGLVVDAVPACKLARHDQRARLVQEEERVLELEVFLLEGGVGDGAVVEGVDGKDLQHAAGRLTVDRFDGGDLLHDGRGVADPLHAAHFVEERFGHAEAVARHDQLGLAGDLLGRGAQDRGDAVVGEGHRDDRRDAQRDAERGQHRAQEVDAQVTERDETEERAHGVVSCGRSRAARRWRPARRQAPARRRTLPAACPRR